MKKRFYKTKYRYDLVFAKNFIYTCIHVFLATNKDDRFRVIQSDNLQVREFPVVLSSIRPLLFGKWKKVIIMYRTECT